MGSRPDAPPGLESQRLTVHVEAARRARAPEPRRGSLLLAAVVIITVINMGADEALAALQGHLCLTVQEDNQTVPWRGQRGHMGSDTPAVRPRVLFVFDLT